MVEFYAGSTLIGSSTTKPYGFVWNNVLPGSYSLTARAVDSTGAATVSAARHVMVESGMAADGVYFIEVDHLNTPRLISDQAGTTVWRWENSDPFGNNPPEEDPDGDGRRFEFNLRFPGQYYDSETGLHYNFFRDYDPGLGRYTTSDPIGLAGGVNTYLYVSGNPISNVDPLGLQGTPGFDPIKPGPPRRQLCIRWLCTVCEPSCEGEKCKRFFVSAPPGRPGEGGFVGNGGYAGDASKMKECMCVESVPYPY